MKVHHFFPKVGVSPDPAPITQDPAFVRGLSVCYPGTTLKDLQEEIELLFGHFVATGIVVIEEERVPTLVRSG